MGADRYSISELVGDLKRMCAQLKDERESLSSVRPLVRRAALSKATWFEDRMYRSLKGHAELKQVGKKVCDIGDVVAMPLGMIHGVWNEPDSRARGFFQFLIAINVRNGGELRCLRKHAQ